MRDIVKGMGKKWIKPFIAISMGLITFVPLSADITVSFPKGMAASEYKVESELLSDLLLPRTERPQAKKNRMEVKEDSFVIPVLSEGEGQYVFPIDGNNYIVVYASPEENINVNIESVSPLSYTISGSHLMTDVARLDSEATKLLSRYREEMQSGKGGAETTIYFQQLYNSLFNDYIEANKDAEGVAYAVMHLEGEDFIKAYEKMTPEARKSRLMPLLETQKEYVERSLESERRMAEMQSGNVDAPDFSFNDVDGKRISLSDFRGKWVVIDFWGSWCGWCIKGFPALKEAYREYAGKVEVLGVACNDPYDAWKKALVKYELPWVNVFNPTEGGGPVLEQYGVKGFPTKVIVSPEGKIKNITSGENPAFFDILSNLVSGQK